MSSGGGRNGVVKMAALKEERSYGLSCGRVGGRVSVFHVKLTDSALRAFESYQHCQVQGRGQGVHEGEYWAKL